MKTILFLSAFIFSSSLFAQTNFVFNNKMKNIINAVEIAQFSTEKDYIGMLKTSCKRNSCTSLENIKIVEAGKNIVLCNMHYLKRNQLKNVGASSICNHKQPVFGCDSHATPLLRKMCYTANKYSLSLWNKKETNMKKRRPASQ